MCKRFLFVAYILHTLSWLLRQPGVPCKGENKGDLFGNSGILKGELPRVSHREHKGIGKLVNMSSKPNSTPLSSRRRLLFSAGMVLIPVLFFALLEGGLRLVEYGDSYPLFLPVDGYEDYLYPNQDVARRYFAQQQSIPNIPFGSFKATKDSNTFRIFVQGGSSAAGFPFYYGGSFSVMLRQRLLRTFPGRDIEVINTAMAAVNSYTLLDLADEIIAQKPNAVLIYAGHNEYYGALGVGSSESLGQFRSVVKGYLSLQDLRVMQGLRAFLSTVAGWFSARQQGEEPGGTLMERMVGQQSIPYGAASYELGLGQFRGNMSDLLARYKAHQIPVFISTLVSNERDQRPFVSDLAAETDAEAWQASYEAGFQAIARGDTASALVAFDDAIQLDSTSADVFFARAKVLDAANRFDEAREAYTAAKDRDQLPFRAPSAINTIIREEAARHGAYVAETHEAMSNASPSRVVGDDYMLEHLHPNIEGYLRIADAFYEALQAQNMIGEWIQPVSLEKARQGLLLTEVDSLLGMIRVNQLKSRWPFQPPGVVDQSLIQFEAETPIDKIALDLYNNDIIWLDATDQERKYFQEQGDFPQALRAIRAIIHHYPFLPRPYVAAGNVLIQLQRYEEALAYFSASNEYDETAEAHRMIGSILLQQEKRETAIDHLERSLELEPENQQALYNLSGAYALSQQFEKARTTVNRLLEIAPSHQGGQQLLASLPATANR